MQKVFTMQGAQYAKGWTASVSVSKPPRLSDLQDKVEKDGVAAVKAGGKPCSAAGCGWTRKLTTAGLRELQVLHTRKA